MDLLVFCAVLSAALMHATWNTLARGSGEPFNAIVAICLMQIPVCLALLAWFGFPSWQSCFWLPIGMALHVGYNVFLIQAYTHGDMSQVYPLARGASPLFVAVASAAFLGETMGLEKTVAVLLIAGGVIAMSLRGGPAPALAHPARHVQRRVGGEHRHQDGEEHQILAVITVEHGVGWGHVHLLWGTSGPEPGPGQGKSGGRLYTRRPCLEPEIRTKMAPGSEQKLCLFWHWPPSCDR